MSPRNRPRIWNGKQLLFTIIKITESKESKSIHRLDLSGLTGPGGGSYPPSLATARLLNFRMRTIQGRILEILGATLHGKKTSGKKFSSWVEVFLLFGNFGKCCSIRYRKLQKIQTRRFGWMQTALWFQQFVSQRDNFHDLCPIALWRKYNSS